MQVAFHTKCGGFVVNPFLSCVNYELFASTENFGACQLTTSPIMAMVMVKVMIVGRVCRVGVHVYNCVNPYYPARMRKG